MVKTRLVMRGDSAASGSLAVAERWNSRQRLVLLSACLIGVFVGAETASMASAIQPPAEKSKPTQFCASLLSVRGSAESDPSLKIIDAHLNPAGQVPARGPGGGQAPAPAHCEVTGMLHDRIGADGQHYAIKFHMRLPIQWNGRFIFQGGGGTNGDVGSAVAPLGVGQRNGLERGYAVVSQDSGHDNAVNSDPSRQGPSAFGYDAEARRDYAYASHPLVTRTAKAIIAVAYGRPPEYSYFVGCSKGGQEGMMMAQRYPTYFDGILASAPGFTIPKAGAIGATWDLQAMAKVATSVGAFDAHGVPLLNKAFSNEDLAIASRAVLAACDSLDGVADGMVQDFRRCTSSVVSRKLAEVTCASAKTDSCLTPVQVEGLKRIFGGAHNSRGELLYADWPWDAGIGGKDARGQYLENWHSWKMGRYASSENSAIDLTLVAAGSSATLVTPPTPMPTDTSTLTRWALAFDFDRDAPNIFFSNQEFPESAWDMFSADSMDRTQFRDHGGKLVIVHGVSDPIFSINDTIRWVTALDRVEGGTAANFVRLFAVPGMSHCGGGPATDEYDAFQALVDWVEKHQAPEVILATAGPAAPWPGRTRPLCRYPKVATYRGHGDIEKAENFVCE